MAGRRNRQEHRAKQDKKKQNAKKEYKPKPAAPGQAKQQVTRLPTIDMPMILAAMRKDYESKLDPSQRRPGGEHIEEALFSVVEQAFGAVKSKQKRGKLNIAVDQEDLKSKTLPILDTMAGGLKEAFLAKWIPELTKLISPPTPEPIVEGAVDPPKTKFDAIDAVGLAALLLHRKQTPET